MREPVARPAPQSSPEQGVASAERELDRRAVAARTVLAASLCLPGQAANDPVDPIRMLGRRVRFTAMVMAGFALATGWLLLIALLTQRLLPPGPG